MIGRFPYDHLTNELREINRDFFDEIKKKQPQLTKEEQKEEKRFIIDTLREQIKLKQEHLNSLFEVVMLTPKKETELLTVTIVEPNLGDIEDECIELEEEVKMLVTALNHALVLDNNDVLGWNRLGEILFDGKNLGLSGYAFLIATKIDSSFFEAWEGKAKTVTILNRDWEQWPMTIGDQYDDDTPQKVKSKAWTKLAVDETDRSMKLRLALRAVQEGAKTHEIKDLIFKLSETDPITDPASWIPRWKALSRSWEIWGDREMASLCHSRLQIRLHLAQDKALEEGAAPWVTLYSPVNNGSSG